MLEQVEKHNLQRLYELSQKIIRMDEHFAALVC